MKKILVVDDEKNHRLMLKLHLTDAGYECIEAENGKVAYDIIKSFSPDAVLLDITMDVMDGLSLLNKLRNEGNAVPAVMITARTDAKTAVSAMKLGATDFLTKPVDTDELLTALSQILSKEPEKTRPESDYEFRGIYASQAMKETIEMLSLVAPTDATVLILGESGTGKELAARSVHANSPRKNRPFVAVNCAALNENLIESELFGHVKGAFTGAVSARKGRFEQAGDGTIFLDEIGEIPLSTQTKLLRTLQERVYEPVGSSSAVAAEARIIAATNKNLKKMSEDGSFREDLYFRLNVFPVTLPPLRERTEDIPALVGYFIEKYAPRFGKNITSATEGYISALKNYDFPGNIRELENMVERSVILARGDRLTEDYLPALSSGDDTLKGREKEALLNALKRSNGNKTAAAKLLGISRRALYYKLEQYGIEG